MHRIVLIHGAATTAAMWNGMVALLVPEFEVVTPQRRYSGDWDTELDDLEAVCHGAFVVGVSGGATLAIGLAERGIPALGYLAHEPAAGSLAPHLLDQVTAAMRERGVEGFGTALYGPGWTMANAPADDSAVSRDLAMFRRFEPARPTRPLDTVLLTVGERSPVIRHHSVSALAELIGARVAVVPGASHAVHLDAPAQLARMMRTQTTATEGTRSA